MLNLFSYTGSVSCYAIAGGAAFTRSVDISPVYSEWQQENCELNMFDPNTYGILTRDCRKFLWESRSNLTLFQTHRHLAKQNETIWAIFKCKNMGAN